MRIDEFRVNGIYLEYGEERVRLRRKMAQVLQTLLDRPNRCVSTVALYDILYGDDPAGGPVSNVVSVMVSLLRKIFRDRQVPLEIITHDGIGWELRCRSTK